MKFLKLLGGLLVFIILVTAALSFLSADHQTVQRSIKIHKDPKTIYDLLSRLENFNKIAVWNQQDSSASFSTSGTDGTVGASTQWKGHPMISGEGRITITGLTPPNKIMHRIEFSKPKKGKADSVFELIATNTDSTLVTWTFDLHTPRPWNIFNLFYSLDKEKGSEFEDGLKLLKAMIEK
jgi:hypothetical protein